MFKIIGADGKEYGPVTSEQIRNWIAQGRVTAGTSVQMEGSSDWQNLNDIPEFSDLLRSRAAAATPAPPPTTPKTSVAAVTSLVLGILGFLTCGITSLIGLVLGIVAMIRIKKSDGRFSGYGMALTGTILSACMVLIVPIGFAVMLPAFSKTKEKLLALACVSNEQQLAMAVRTYATDHENQLPPAASWCDAIQSTVPTSQAFRCLAAKSGQRCDYALNANVGGKNLSDVSPATVLIFESTGGWNVSGGRELLPQKSRHGSVFVVALANGTVKQVEESQLDTLRWEP